MADTDAGIDGPEGADDEVEAEPAATAPTDDQQEPEVGRTDLKVARARATLEEEAEAARRRVLGVNRGRLRPASVQTDVVADDEADLRERLREMVRGVEEETERLQDDVTRLRSAAGRAGATLHEEIERAADELAEAAVGDLAVSVGQATGESLAGLTVGIESLQETAASLNQVAASLLTSVEQLATVAPVTEQLAQLAGAPPTIPDALAGILRDLTDQLSALGDAVAVQVRATLEEALATELGRHDARIEHALARVVDELARLRRRLPVTKKGAQIELSKEQLTEIGQAVGDYLLGAMREQKS